MSRSLETGIVFPISCGILLLGCLFLIFAYTSLSQTRAHSMNLLYEAGERARWIHVGAEDYVDPADERRGTLSLFCSEGAACLELGLWISDDLNYALRKEGGLK